MTEQPLLTVSGLSVIYSTGARKQLTAVRGVSFTLVHGETLGIIGESGSGKSSLAMAVAMLVPYSSGSVVFDDEDLGTLSRRQLRRARRSWQVIFQDPASALDPRLTIGHSIIEPLLVQHSDLPKESIRAAAREAMERVHLPGDVMNRYPHELSGGQKQRVTIARAITLRPKLLVCDEPTSALDVSLQVSVLALLRDLKESLQLSMLFVSHDLALVESISDRTAVMHHGEFVEVADSKELVRNPQHEYTAKLIAAHPPAAPLNG